MAEAVPYTALFDGSAPTVPIDDESVGDFLRCAIGLSAWKQFRDSRWALRVNPSSGNLHPTEAYVVRDAGVLHYAPREHAVEQRCAFDAGAWARFSGGAEGFLVALTSIHWREAWKYGERAFRYCQHDAGHAIAALRFSAARLGWRLSLLPRWSHDDMTTLLGLDRNDDFARAEPEEPECIAVVTPGDARLWLAADPSPLVAAARAAVWSGQANQLSPAHVEWPIIGDVAQATRYPGSSGDAPVPSSVSSAHAPAPPAAAAAHVDPGAPLPSPAALKGRRDVARRIILQRRSALGFDARSSLPRATFLAMLHRTLPGRPPWDAIDWDPLVHLLVFVHRIDGMTPGLYAWLREPAVADEWRERMRQEFLWEPVQEPGTSIERHLFLLVPTDVGWIANRLSCDQDIAADGFFSLGMLARLESTLLERGAWCYRRAFWETGILGQILYLEAEAAGARSTGIGCFYDDPVHDMAGLSGHEWQSLYHFSMGAPVDDGRLTTEPGYEWERESPPPR